MNEPKPPVINVRLIPVRKKGKGHEEHIDGYVIDPRDRGGRKNRKGKAR